MREPVSHVIPTNTKRSANVGIQTRSQGRKSDEARPGGQAKISKKPKFLRILSDEKE